MEAKHFVSNSTTYIGQQFGNYQIESPLGRGAFATVFLGKHLFLDTKVAIKILHRQFVDFEKQLFNSEARLSARLIHPHIVRVLEYGMQSNRPYLVMDYASRGTLGQFSGLKLPLSLVVRYAKQIASGLDYLNAQGIIHCDIKPQNLLMGRDEQILISDFGIALLVENAAAAQEGIIRGTPAYMAPEQIMGYPCFASDQYALAVVIYELLCGTLPFEGTRDEVVNLHLYANPPSMREYRLSIPFALEEVIIRALLKEPKQRYNTAGEFAIALEQAFHASTKKIYITPRVEEAQSNPIAKMKPVAIRRGASRPKHNAVRQFAIATMYCGDLMALVLIWLFSISTLNGGLVAAWLFAFWVISCIFMAIITKRRQTLQIFACIFAIGLLASFIFHSIFAFPLLLFILRSCSMFVTLRWSMHKA